MGALSRVVGVLIGVALLAGVGTAWAEPGSEDKKPEVTGTSVSDVTSAGALLKATIHPQDRPTTYVFEYGTTTAYGSPTPQASAGDSDAAQPVSAPVGGLQPFTTYHFRAVATNDHGTTRGPDKTFTTLAAPPGGGAAPQTPTPGTATPELGSSVLVAPGRGQLTVRRPGAAGFVRSSSAPSCPWEPRSMPAPARSR